jgi:RNA polymerase sigma-70 factor (ECF subfamily)
METVTDVDIAQLRDALPGVTFDEGAFAAHVKRCAARGTKPEHLVDLLRAFAALAGDACALRDVEAALVSAAAQGLRRLALDHALADDVVQQARTKLFVAEGATPPRLSEYLGQGPLQAWLRAVVVRLALDARRTPTPTAPETALAELVDSEEDPELRLLKQTYRLEYRTALTQALAALEPRDRNVLRLHLVDGLRLSRIARLYEVHESTASRWVARALAAVADDAKARLAKQLRASPDTVDSLGRVLRSQLDLSVARLLATSSDHGLED